MLFRSGRIYQAAGVKSLERAGGSCKNVAGGVFYQRIGAGNWFSSLSAYFAQLWVRLLFLQLGGPGVYTGADFREVSFELGGVEKDALAVEDILLKLSGKEMGKSKEHGAVLLLKYIGTVARTLLPVNIAKIG